MLPLDLNQEEQALLVDLLGTCIDALHDEIAHTERVNDKERLKERRRVLTKLRETLLRRVETLGL